MNSNHTCLAVISLDSTFNKDIDYYLQVFKRMYINWNRKKVIGHIVDDLESSSDDSDESDEK